MTNNKEHHQSCQQTFKAYQLTKHLKMKVMLFSFSTQIVRELEHRGALPHVMFRTLWKVSLFALPNKLNMLTIIVRPWNSKSIVSENFRTATDSHLKTLKMPWFMVGLMYMVIGNLKTKLSPGQTRLSLLKN